MVTQALREAIAALTDEERYELIRYVEDTLDDDMPPPDEATIAMLKSRLEEMRRDPSVGLTREEHEKQIRALLA